MDSWIQIEKLDRQGIQWITGPESQELTHGWRADEDAILVGRKTVDIDNPSLTVRAVDGKNPIRIVIDPKQSLTDEKSVFDDQSQTIKLASEGQEGPNVLVEPEGAMWLKNQLVKLLKMGIGSIIVEGGKFTLGPIH